LGDRGDGHVFASWGWVGTARDQGDLDELLQAPPQPAFDPDVTRLLLRRHAARKLPLMDPSHSHAAGRASDPA
jgi:hypothetical protein